ncbi:MAG: RNA polymerase sigma factor RpoD/SigA [Spirochaetales bacterium]|nr:RNA polymerase sigma factor RpoD/SigA [Spirochaetales bacterium]
MKTRHKQQGDELTTYFCQIRRTPLLTFEEEQDLSKRIQRGDEEAKRRLIEANLRLVVKIAKAYSSQDVNFLDIVQEGNLGLMKAASRFDYRKNVRFSTYAAWWIRQSIVRSLSNKRRPIRLPHRKEELLRTIKQSYYLLSQRYQRKPSVAEVAEDLNLKEKEVSSLLHISGVVASLDNDLGNESGTLMDICEDYTYQPDKEIIRKGLREDTIRFLEHLLDKEKQILLYRFSFYGGSKYTLKRIGEEMGISPETVRQIEIRALKKLREHSEELREYIYN